jgi:dipeptidyl aminopeptidase/acylaminoacyl peptidase
MTTLALAWVSLRKAPDATAVIRLSILPPENASFESFAVSPDGRTVAFTADWKGSQVLWVRPIGSLDAKPLAGTESASQVFWSPDGHSIAFFTSSKLKTIGIDGGPAREIADIVVGRGGTWNRDGVILFNPKPGGVLYQLSANGGVPRPATSLDASRAEVSHALPQFLPDGRRFLYLASSLRPGASAIRVGSLDGKTSKVLLPADAGVGYAPASRTRPASLFFLHDGALVAQPFDPRTLALSGEKTIIAPAVRYRRWRDRGFSVSDNGTLLYQAGSYWLRGVRRLCLRVTDYSPCKRDFLSARQ